MIDADDLTWMGRCLELARRGEGLTDPNPMVGAVIVQGGALLAEGWHHAVGLAHAEVDALAHLGGVAPGATLYVNLEPCCHHGRTPPCTDAILRAGIARVVVGMIDPNPRVSARGVEILRAAGLVVDVGAREGECRALNQAFIARMLALHSGPSA